VIRSNRGPTRAVSEINGDYIFKTPVFPAPVYLTPAPSVFWIFNAFWRKNN